MYSDRKRSRALPALVCALILLVLCVAFLRFRGSGSDLTEESAAALEATVRRGALQCYAVEGVYPPDLAYLEDNYGLQINTRDFYVSYEAFSSNLPPDVIVVPR